MTETPDFDSATEQNEATPAKSFAERIPESARAKLTADEQEYSDEFDRLDSQSIFSDPQIREKLAEKGLRPNPTAEEVEAAEVADIQAKAASAVHHKRTKSSRVLMRPKGSIQRDIRDGDERVKTDRELRGDFLE